MIILLSVLLPFAPAVAVDRVHGSVGFPPLVALLSRDLPLREYMLTSVMIMMAEALTSRGSKARC